MVRYPADPFRQLAKAVGPQGVDAAPALGPDDHEVGVLVYLQLPRDAGLPDAHHRHELVGRALAVAQGVDGAAPGGVSQDLEHVRHSNIYRVNNVPGRRN